MDVNILADIVVSMHGIDEYRQVALELQNIGFKWITGEDLLKYEPPINRDKYIYLYFNRGIYPKVVTFGTLNPGTEYTVIQKDELFDKLLVSEPICIDEINIKEVLI